MNADLRSLQSEVRKSCTYYTVPMLGVEFKAICLLPATWVIIAHPSNKGESKFPPLRLTIHPFIPIILHTIIVDFKNR